MLHRPLSVCIALCLSLLLCACASNASRTADINAHMYRQQRLNRVASTVLTAGTPMCGSHLSYDIGLGNLRWHWFGVEWEQAYATNHGLDRDFRIQEVVPGSPADKAGIQVGDRVLALDGEPFLPGHKAYLGFKKKLREKLAGGATPTFELERNGQRFSTRVTPELQCGFPVLMSAQFYEKATDGVQIFLPWMMIDFVRNDAELAAVISHELGHDVLEHASQKTGELVMKGVLSVLTLGATDAATTGMGDVYTDAFNKQADYLSVHFMELAGYDSTQALEFMQRTGLEDVYLDGYAKDHPVTADRLAFLKRTIAEVKAKKANGEEPTATMAEAVQAQQAWDAKGQ